MELCKGVLLSGVVIIAYGFTYRFLNGLNILSPLNLEFKNIRLGNNKVG